MTSNDAEAAATTAAPDRSHEAIRAAWREIDERTDAFIAIVREGLNDHRRVVQETGLTGPRPEKWETASDGLVEYRKTVSDKLLEPIRGFFGEGGGGGLLPGRVAEGLVAEWDLAQELPREVATPWPEGGLQNHSWDGRRTRVRKSIARVVSPARRAGGSRDLPMRATVQRHLLDVVIPGEDVAVVAAMDSFQVWTLEVQRAWMTWADRAIPAMAGFDAPAPEDAPDAWEVLREAAAELEASLEVLLEESPRHGDAAEARLADWSQRLDADLGVAGSFALPLGGPTPVRPPGLKRATKNAVAHQEWILGASARMELGLALLRLLAGTTAVHRRFSYRVEKLCESAAEALPPAADELARLIGSVNVSSVERLESLRADVAARLQPAVDSVPAADDVRSTVDVGVDGIVDALVAMTRQMPEAVAVHAEGAKPPTGGRPVETRSVPLRDLTRQSFDALRIERIRASTSGLVEAVDVVRTNVAALTEVLEYAYDAAATELDGDAEGAAARSQELVEDALRNLSESLKHEVLSLEQGLSEATRRLAAEIGEGSVSLLDRLAAGRMQGQLLAAQSRFADARAQLNERWGPPVDRAARLVALRWRKLRRLATRSLRRGSELVGKGGAEVEGATRSIRVLAEAQTVIDRMPLVYQRLFTLDPLPEPGLMIGRRAELEAALARWRGWETGEGVPIVLRGRPGSGVTSLLNAIGASIEEQDRVVARVVLDDRIEHEGLLAKRITEALGLPPCESLRDVARALFVADREAVPTVVLVDDMEHLFLRVPGGTDLIERLLTLMAETEPRVFWVGGVSSSAWQVVATGEPIAVSQVDVLDLPPLGAASVREAVLLRHRRSGLQIQYEEPPAGRRLLTRRLKRARTPEARAQLLEDDFFEQLQRASSGNLRLALFQWMQSADFEQGEKVLMRAVARPSFGVLDGLDLTQNFTLKAFLEHRTLTLAEHDGVFRLPTQESFQILESLGNRHLIAPVDDASIAGLDRSEAEANLRYRIQPLLVGAITAHLASRNIVH